VANITNYFEQAKLSLAAYAVGLTPGISGAAYRDKLQAIGMSAKQAEEFATTYTVIVQSPESSFLGDGFSATAFQNVASGEISIAIRGSERTFNGLWEGAR